MYIRNLIFLLFFLISSQAWSACPGGVCYVRIDGGTNVQCDGGTDHALAGASGTNCAFSHPAYAIGATGTTGAMTGGDDLIVDNNEYMIGYGMPHTSGCSAAAAYDCELDALPAGPSSADRTRILGEGHDTGCSGTKAQFWGTERVWQVLNLTSANHTEIKCLDITDHSACIENGPSDGSVDGFPVKCERDSDPFGTWASAGIQTDAATTDVLLTDVDIHGLAKNGIMGYRNGDWTLTRTNIIANGFVGWDSDGTGDDSYTATTTLIDSKIEWSGCGERYPLTVSDWSSSTDKHHCWSQAQGGFGDGIGLGDGDVGNWVFLRSSISFNVSDGVDLLHGNGAGTVKFTQSKAEGNAGNQLKLNATESWVENSLLIGNCQFHHGQSFVSTKSQAGASVAFESCRAFGNTIVFANSIGDQQMHISNSTITGSGDCLVIMEGSATGCNGGTLAKFDNNIMIGGRDANDDVGLWNSSGGNDDTCLFDNPASGACASVVPDIDNSFVYATKNIGSDTLCSGGTNNACNVDPVFDGTIKQGCGSGAGNCTASDYYQSADYADQLYLDVTSPAINDASEAITCEEDCSVDYNNFDRGASWDIGALEYGSVPSGGGGGQSGIGLLNIGSGQLRLGAGRLNL